MWRGGNGPGKDAEVGPALTFAKGGIRWEAPASSWLRPCGPGVLLRVQPGSQPWRRRRTLI